MALQHLIKPISVNTSALGRLLQLKLFSTTACLKQPFGVSDNALVNKCAQQLEEIHQAGTYKVETNITTPQGASVGKALITCCS